MSAKTIREKATKYNGTSTASNKNIANITEKKSEVNRDRFIYVAEDRDKSTGTKE